jgi:CRISPR/Cas system CSM-associated protein Csm5 (group 7 of RAMP superfamily)
LRAFYLYIKARIAIGIFPNIIQKSDTSQRTFYSERERKNAKEQLERSEHASDIIRTNETSCSSSSNNKSFIITKRRHKIGGKMQTKMRPKKAATTASAATSGGVQTIGETFKKLKSENKIAFIPFVVAGDPNLEATAKALKILGALLMLVFRLLCLCLCLRTDETTLSLS